MNFYTVITETVIRRAYEVEATSPEGATAIFGPNVDVEDDGSIYDDNGEEVVSPYCGEAVRRVLECRLDSTDNSAEPRGTDERSS